MSQNVYNINLKMKWKFKIWKIYFYLLFCYPFINSCDLVCFYHKMVVEIKFNNKIKIFLFSNQNLFLRGKNIFVYIIEMDLSLNFSIVI
jgi:hypothetical protein